MSSEQDYSNLDAEQDPKVYQHRVVHIDPLDLQREYIRLPADLAHYNAKLARAIEDFLESEASFECLEAKLYRSYRLKFEMEDRKVTEALIQSAVKTDPQWLKARMDLVSTEAEKARIKGHVEAIHAKREMLVSLGAHVRKEMGHDPRIRDQHKHYNQDLQEPLDEFIDT